MKTAGLVTLLLLSVAAWSAEGGGRVPLRDLMAVEGVRANPLVGYGLVVGLNGTGDRQQTIFSVQMLANMLQRLGVRIPATSVKVNNIAAVFVTASLPPFARPGTGIDVTVSSIGDAKSLEGGLLLLTPLHGSDGEAYAVAQGPVTLGGYTAGMAGNSKQVNHPTVGRIPQGATVERSAPGSLAGVQELNLLLRQADFTTAMEAAATINSALGRQAATAVDNGRVTVKLEAGVSAPALLAQIENLQVTVHPYAKVVVNERTGTVVLGRNVRLGAVSILHGNLTVEVATELDVSQPQGFSKGQTAVVPQTKVTAKEMPAHHVELNEGATVEQLVAGLQAIGATARDVVAILQAIKAAGALNAELEVI